MATIEERLKAIEERLKAIEQKPVAGWYRTDNTGVYLAFSDGETLIYGFDYQDNWFYTDRESLDFSDNYYNPADPKEVEQRLIEEAKRRGFKEGVKYSCFETDQFHTIKSFLVYDEDENWVADGYGGVVFKDGIWATIIPEPLTLNGKEVIVDDLGIRIGIIHTYGDSLKTFLNHCSNLGIVEVESKIFGKVLTTEILELLTKIEEHENR